MSESSIIVSHSEDDTFLQCERKHFYAFSNGGLQKKELSEPLVRGVMGHKMLEIFFSTLKDGSTYSDARSAANAWLQSQMVLPDADLSIIAKVLFLVNTFIDYYSERIAGWKILYVEHEFWLNISDRIRFPFKPDLIISENGIITVVDYKFTYDFYTDSMLQLLGQTAKYVGALRALGVEARAAWYAQLRTRTMKDMSAPNIMKISPIPLNNSRIVRTFKEQINVTHRIARYKEMTLEEWDDNAVRTLNTMICKSCSFKDLCAAELNGSDGQLMRKVDFDKNTYGYKEAEE